MSQESLKVSNTLGKDLTYRTSGDRPKIGLSYLALPLAIGEQESKISSFHCFRIEIMNKKMMAMTFLRFMKKIAFFGA